jgi:AcrR family transcriptional regulator
MAPPKKSDFASQRRDEVLAAATDAFLQAGYAGTSMADLAKAIGIQKASLYHHFPSKLALFVACVTEGYEGTIKRLDEIRTDENLSDLQRIAAVIEELYRINLETPTGRMAPLISEVAQQIPEVAETFHNGFIVRQYEIVRAIIEAGVARKSFAEVDSLGMQHLIFGPIVTLSLSLEMTAKFDNRDELYPVKRIKSSHAELILKLLTRG